MVPYPATCYYTSFLSLSACQHTIRLAINWLDYVIKNSSGIYESNHGGKLIAFYVPKPSLPTSPDIQRETLWRNVTPPSQKQPRRRVSGYFFHLGVLIWYHLKEENPREFLFLFSGGGVMPSLKAKRKHKPVCCSNQNVSPNSSTNDF